MAGPMPPPGYQPSFVDILITNAAYEDQLRGALNAYQLELHLLQLPLFHEGEQLFDESVDPAQTWPCQDLRLLVRGLTMALGTYNYLIKLADDAPALLQQKTQHALGHVDLILTLEQELRQRRALTSTHPTRHQPRRARTQAWRSVREDLEALQTYAYQWFAKRIKRQARAYLLQSMVRAFHIFGPQDKRFSRRAMFYAIATVLVDRGMELVPPAVPPDEALNVVRRRLEKRADRATK